MRTINLHLVSDATGETVNSVAKACLVQFDGIEVVEQAWPMVLNQTRVEETLAAIAEAPGLVMYTLVNSELRAILEQGCQALKLPCISVLDPLIAAVGDYLGVSSREQPGLQHEMNAGYFSRIDAMHFVFSHDDGQSDGDLDDADVLLLGVSRTSKTPTCMYLANRGIKAANIPVVPGLPLPAGLDKLTKPLLVGLTNDPARLAQVRRSRLAILGEEAESAYADVDSVRKEVAEARRMFTRMGLPVIDVTRRSIEETAAAILQLYARHRATAR